MSIITKYVSYFIFIFIDLFIYTKIFFREYFFYSPKINKINFIKSVLTVDGLDHKIYEFGDINASNQNTLLLIGGIPTDPMDSMTWLANEINQINDNLRVIILNMPYYEDDFDIDVNNKYAISNGRDLVTDKIIDFSNTRVDCKFSHENQGKKIKHFLDESGSKVVFSTYQSSQLIVQAQEHHDTSEFDLVIANGDCRLFKYAKSNKNILFSHSLQSIEKFLRKKSLLPVFKLEREITIKNALWKLRE